MQVRLLGPVDVVVDGAARDVPGVRRRSVLAVLALHAGEVVTVDRLVDVVWGDRAPASALGTLQSHVSYLRRLLGPGAVVRRRSTGYVLEVGRDGTDLFVAERLVRAGREAGDPAQGAELLRRALDTWRGPALADVAGGPALDGYVRRLEAVRSQARRSLVDALLAVGRYPEAVQEVEGCLRGAPLDEELHERAMLALYRAGRQADALAHFERVRALLDRELGVVPGPALRALHGAILRHDAGLGTPGRAVGGPHEPVVPRQLPAPLSGLAGREPELAHLDELLDDAAAGSPGGLLAVVSGMAGVGKTTLAAAWAHRVAGRFPDGQLYVNLRGFDPARPPMEPAEALRGFLLALGVAPPSVPSDPEARAALYRTLLADRRVLVFLDNARDADQVRPLLPGHGGSSVVVTSRDDLRALVATEGARPVGLAMLTTAACHDLLVHRLGKDRVSAEPEAVAEIVERCARLPLALAVVAASAAASPGFPLAALAAELRADVGGPLGVLDGGAASSGLRAVFARSYDGLSDPAARTFRLLALHPGPDISTAAAAGLTDLSPERVHAELAELARAHLVVREAPRRWALHDLLRAFAAELTLARDGGPTRSAALRRVLDHYLHTAHAATTAIYGEPDAPPPPSPVAGARPAAPSGPAEARDWFVAEQHVLPGVVEAARRGGEGARAWRLAAVLTDDLRYRQYDAHALVAVHEVGLAAADAAGERAGLAHAHLGIGVGLSTLGRSEAAASRLRTARDLFSGLGDRNGRGRALHALAFLGHRAGARDAALGLYREAIEEFRAGDRAAGLALSLNNVAELYAGSGRAREALGVAREALGLLAGRGFPQREAAVRDTIGHVLHVLGEHGEALACFARAIDLYTVVGNELFVAETLVRAGDAHRAAGDLPAARAAWRRALDVLERLGHPEATTPRARLADESRAPGARAEAARVDGEGAA